MSKTKKTNKNKIEKKSQCGPGEILRKGYRRKGFYRDEFTRKDGTVVAASYVPETIVPPTCVLDTGRPGRGKQILPKPDDLIHLTKYGWSIHASKTQRHNALRAASNDYGILPVLQRLNLLRNYQYIPQNKEIFTDDVEFMKDLYDPYRKTPRRTPKYNVRENEKEISRWENPNNWISYRNNRSKKTGQYDKNKKNSKHNYKLKSKRYGQRGGQDNSLTSDTLDDQNDTLDMNDTDTSDDDAVEIQQIEINTIVDKTKVCNSEGKCGVRNIIYEMHQVDEKQIIYYTLEEKDANDILELDKIFMNPIRDRDSVLNNLRNNYGLLIGIKVDGKLEGYCQYEPYDNLEVKITWFCANKGYRTPLYNFMEKYFRLNDYTRIMIDVILTEANSTSMINFWYGMEFVTYHNLPEKNILHMEKYI